MASISQLFNQASLWVYVFWLRNRDRYKGGGRSGRVEEAIIEKVLEQIDEGGIEGDIDEAQW